MGECFHQRQHDEKVALRRWAVVPITSASFSSPTSGVLATKTLLSELGAWLEDTPVAEAGDEHARLW